jgi:predicted nuclease with TOPRIM domain
MICNNKGMGFSMAAINDEIQSRLGELRADYARGRQQLQELTEQEALLRETLLRISGAIQALEELVAVAAPADVETDNAAVPGTMLHVP